MTDLYDLFTGEDDSARMQAEALTSALRRKQAVGQLALLTGDKVLGRFGETMLGDASQQQGMVAQAGSQRSGQRLQRALQAQQQVFSAGEAEKDRGFRASESARGRAAEANALRLTLGAKEKERAAAAEAAGVKRVADTEEELRKEFTSNAAYKLAQTAVSGLRQIQAASNDGTGDLQRIFAFVNLIDPGSVVRAEDVRTVGATGGLPGIAQAYFNQLTANGSLSDDVRRKVTASAASIAQTRLQSARETEAAYKKLAADYGANPERVTLPVGLDLNAPAPRAAAPAAASDMVQVQKPDGQVVAVPKANLKRALELGGKVVSDGG